MKSYRKREEYAGRAQTNEQNREDGSMMMSGANDFAHLPREVIMKPYPSVYGYPDTRLMNNSDNIKGIDDQIGSDMSGARKHVARVKL